MTLRQNSSHDSRTEPDRQIGGRKIGRWVPDLVPVAVIAAYGITWIALHTSAGRGQVHTLLQVAALAENVVALTLRRRKPVGALIGILVVYAVTELVPLTLPALVLALYTVVTDSMPRRAMWCSVAAGLIIAATAVAGRGSLVPALIALGASGLAVAIGKYVRARHGAAD